jgi:hypothetical protein
MMSFPKVSSGHRAFACLLAGATLSDSNLVLNGSF